MDNWGVAFVMHILKPCSSKHQAKYMSQDLQCRRLAENKENWHMIIHAACQTLDIKHLIQSPIHLLLLVV